MTPHRLMEALLARCLSGDCDHATAAKLLGVRKASVAELVRRHQGKTLALSTLRSAFHTAFPDCNPALRRGLSGPGLKHDNLLRPYPVAPCRTYTADEVADLPPAQPHLKAQREPESGPMSYNTNNRADDFMRAMRRRIERADHEPPLETTGDEFEFERVA